MRVQVYWMEMLGSIIMHKYVVDSCKYLYFPKVNSGSVWTIFRCAVRVVRRGIITVNLLTCV